MNQKIYLGLAAIIGGFSISSIVLMAIFAPQSMSLVPWIIGALCIMGIAFGWMALKSESN